MKKYPTFEELQLAFRNKEASRPITHSNHCEFVLDGIRYYCGYASPRKNYNDGTTSKGGWVTYKYSIEKEYPNKKSVNKLIKEDLICVSYYADKKLIDRRFLKKEDHYLESYSIGYTIVRCSEFLEITKVVDNSKINNNIKVYCKWC